VSEVGSPEPYWTDGQVTLYCGDFREVLPALGVTPDLVLADPPYGQTGLPWDRWPRDWPSALAPFARSMWCFGSLRMFMDHRDEFTDWKMSQDAVWEKNTGSAPARDRLRRVHDSAVHWYQGRWDGIYHECPRVPHDGPNWGTRRRTVADIDHASGGRFGDVSWVDDGQRQVRSVIKAANLRGKAINATEKPTDVLTPLIEYGSPPGGLVVDIFAGSCSALVAARATGRRAIGIEAREEQCETAVRERLAGQQLSMDWSA
jgi:site-specific DNA-methyltransferase (adenine-specific)